MEQPALVVQEEAMEEEEEEEEEEYILLDLDGVSEHICIPPNAPYGLETPNPFLLIDNKIKLIGEYEETVGTCLVFNDTDACPVVHEETGSSEANLFSGKCIVDANETPTKQVNPVARLDKVLKFRLFQEANDTSQKERPPSKPQS